MNGLIELLLASGYSEAISLQRIFLYLEGSLATETTATLSFQTHLGFVKVRGQCADSPGFSLTRASANTVSTPVPGFDPKTVFFIYPYNLQWKM